MAELIDLFLILLIGDAFNKVKLKAGDDAGDVCWMEANSKLNLYASHKDFIETVVKMKGAAR